MPGQPDPTLSPEPSLPATAVDPESGRIACDLPCVGCQYNLRTLRTNGLCPECGRAVGDSIRELLAGRTEREWVDSLTNGFACLSWASAAIWLALVIGFVMTGFRRVPEGIYAVVLTSGCLGLIALVIGSVLVIAAEPPFLVGQQPRWPGIVFRLGLLGILVFVIVLFALPVILLGFPLTIMLFPPLIGAPPIALGARCGWLADRIQSEASRKVAITAIWVTAASVIAGDAALLAFTAGGEWGIKAAKSVQPPLVLLLIVLFLIGMATWTRLFIKLHRLFAERVERLS